MVENINDIIYYVELTPTVHFRYVVPSLTKLLGEKEGERLEKNGVYYLNRIHPEDLIDFKRKMSGDFDYSKPNSYRVLNKSGTYTWFEERTTPIYKNGKLVALQGILRDITEQRMLQQDLEYRLHHDALTNLYNRTYFEQELERLDVVCDLPVGIIVTDLDDLKLVNDSLGHKAGDELIQKAGEILLNTVGTRGTVARMGGDEFAVLLEEASYQEVQEYSDKLNEQCNGLTSTTHAMLHMSVGFSYLPSSKGKMEKLFIQADQAMYHNKRKHKRISN
ncbi:sensor domain-containing diguanylate cyclase [Bacillus coahuilensis]|uniref:sensor domain-containing diguanylate cyclase n=1 Tax=Bacillus coahuilensis TaxID=408580 RepID=UPI000185093B|nr:sensor domain-containing diguanylate cyclase [Bacillus coahuilensis]